MTLLDAGPGLVVDDAGFDACRTELAVVELGASAVEVGWSGGADVVVSADRTALLQPANPAAVMTRPAAISERREMVIRTETDYVPRTSVSGDGGGRRH